MSLQYRVGDNSYEAEGVRFTPAQITSSNARYITYSSGGGVDTLKLYRPGSGNDELALTYTSFGNLEHHPASFDSVFKSSWFSYGIQTAPASMPTTGSASYSAIVRGSTIPYAGSDPAYAIEGTARFNFEFAASGTFSGYLDPVLVATGGTRTSLERIDLRPQFNNGIIGTGFSLAFGTAGTATGQFYGPNAQEIGGSFKSTFAPPGLPGAGYLLGAFVGARCGGSC